MSTEISKDALVFLDAIGKSKSIAIERGTHAYVQFEALHEQGLAMVWEFQSPYVTVGLTGAGWVVFRDREKQRQQEEEWAHITSVSWMTPEGDVITIQKRGSLYRSRRNAENAVVLFPGDEGYSSAARLYLQLAHTDIQGYLRKAIDLMITLGYHSQAESTAKMGDYIRKQETK